MKSLDTMRAVGSIRVRTATSDEEFDRMTAFYEEGRRGERYRVMCRGEDAILFKQRTWGTIPGHITLFLFTFWTVGIANIAFAFGARQKAAEVIVRRSRAFSPDFEAAWRRSHNKTSDVASAEV